MKYMGSKSRIAKDIVPIIQKYIDENNITNYCEPMCGGCNIIDKIKCDRKFAFDINGYLIHLLIRVKSGKRLHESVSRELYNAARNAWNSGIIEDFEDWEIGNIGFLASYNGRFFDGGYAKPGYEKTKKGLRYRNYYREARDNLLTQAKKKGFQDIMFGIGDYRNLHFETDNNKYVIYLDPPYANKKQFYNSKNFDYDEFWNIIRKWSEKHIVLVSELHAPEDFECIWEKTVNRSIKATDKSKDTEKLFILKEIV